MSIAPTSGDKSAMMATHLAPRSPQPVVNIPPSVAPASEMRKRYSTDYRLAYPKRTIVVAVDPIAGDDRVLDARAARELNQLLEAAAKASRVNR